MKFGEQNENGSGQYPLSRKDPISDSYHGIKIDDPYRWLEDTSSVETKDWIHKQNRHTREFLDKSPLRDKIYHKLSDNWNYKRMMVPVKEGGKYYCYCNNGLQEQYSLYILNNLDAEPKLLFDPNTQKDKNISIFSFSISPSGKYGAIGLSEKGSDWVKIKVIDIESGEWTDDLVVGIKFGGASWFQNGFFYSAYPLEELGKAEFENVEKQQIQYHQLGTPQIEDKLVFEDSGNPLRYNLCQITNDYRLLIIFNLEGTKGSRVFYIDLDNGFSTSVKSLINQFEDDYFLVNNRQGELVFLTNHNAPKFRLVSIDPSFPEAEKWREIIPEKESVLQQVTFCGRHYIANYLENTSNSVRIYDENGGFKHKLELPGLGSAHGFKGDNNSPVLFYGFNSYLHPNTIYSYDIEKNKSKVYHHPLSQANPLDYKIEMVSYKGKDGTSIPMTLVYRKDIELNGHTPVLLYGYGGFNVSLTPNYNPSSLFFVDQGGIYAVPNIRGGGEFGEKWHEEGMLDKKQNSFDDFIAAAEYLIRNDYTSPDELIISGRSNGGLLVGAVMTQRPDLFKVAIPGVAVLDMLRYHQFTVGHGWKSEYGSPDDPYMFKILHKYSPLHNVKEGVDYPAVLIVTALHDDRVVPAHSFKFAATLQEKSNGNTVLLRVDTTAGHGMGKPVSSIIEEYTDLWTFVFDQLGVNTLSN